MWEPEGDMPIPDGFEKHECYINRETGEVVVMGWPSEDNDHNCDQMGCGTLSHVVARLHAAETVRGRTPLH